MPRAKTGGKSIHQRRGVTRSFSMRCKSDPREIGKIEKFLLEMNKVVRLDDGTFYRLLVATTEAVNNAITHGNKRDARRPVEITCELNNASLTVKVRDRGAGFDPSSVPSPLDEDRLLRESGRGIFLMRSLMDRVEFLFDDPGTVVVMVLDLKRLR